MAGGNEDGKMSWGHPGRRFESDVDPLGDMGVGNRRPLLIALAIGAVVASGLYLAWEERAEASEAALEAEGFLPGDSSAAPAKASRAGPPPAQLREEVEKLLKGNLPAPRMRVMKPEERPSSDKPFPSI